MNREEQWVLEIEERRQRRNGKERPRNEVGVGGRFPSSFWCDWNKELFEKIKVSLLLGIDSFKNIHRYICGTPAQSKKTQTPIFGRKRERGRGLIRFRSSPDFQEAKNERVVVGRWVREKSWGGIGSKKVGSSRAGERERKGRKSADFYWKGR